MLGQRKTWAWNVPAPLATEEQKMERMQFGNQDSFQPPRLNSVNLTKGISEKICEGAKKKLIIAKVTII